MLRCPRPFVYLREEHSAEARADPGRTVCMGAASELYVSPILSQYPHDPVVKLTILSGSSGMYLCLIGLVVTISAPGSWARECRLLTWPGDSLTSRWYDVLGWLWVVFYAMNTVYALWSMGVRVGSEDAELKKNFGKEWEAYRMKVRWAIIPGIY